MIFVQQVSETSSAFLQRLDVIRDEIETARSALAAAAEGLQRLEEMAALLEHDATLELTDEDD